MNLRLGINTGFALNRFPLPEEWMKIVGEDLGLRYVQLTADLINPALGDDIINDHVKRIKALCLKYNVKIDSIMTGAFTRVNHFSHPDPKVSSYWLNWFKKFIDLGVAVGATNMSSHFGVMSHHDLRNPERKQKVLRQTVDAWKEIAVYAQQKGMKYLTWEPMSVKREYGETIKEAKRIHNMLEGSAIPIKICLDVEHGDVSSSNPDDTNPYAWLREFAVHAPLIHLKQSLESGGQATFLPEYNAKGKVEPQKVVETLQQAGCTKALLLLELSFKEREPFDSRILDDLKESVRYWREYISD
ncbi:TIM barrel protein [Candidatus Woesearchaeota archaeon]|nr:TIM barrel protein [Candidatus Woesearchaeota archaeon]